MSEREGSQRERAPTGRGWGPAAATWAGRPAGAPAGPSEERAG